MPLLLLEEELILGRGEPWAPLEELDGMLGELLELELADGVDGILLLEELELELGDGMLGELLLDELELGDGMDGILLLDEL